MLSCSRGLTTRYLLFVLLLRLIKNMIIKDCVENRHFMPIDCALQSFKIFFLKNNSEDLPTFIAVYINMLSYIYSCALCIAKRPKAIRHCMLNEIKLGPDYNLKNQACMCMLVYLSTGRATRIRKFLVPSCRTFLNKINSACCPYRPPV